MLVYDFGVYIGEVLGVFLVKFDVKYVIIGYLECWEYYVEGDDVVVVKV